MASLVVDQGLQRIADLASGILAGGTWSSGGTSNIIQSMSVDDSVTAIAAGTTTLGSPTNFLAQQFDAAPTRSGLVVSHVRTLSTAQFNSNTIRRVILHHIVGTSVTGTSATVNGGVDGQAILKTSSFSVIITLDYTYASP